MPQIELLDQQTIDQIAAGEVVDRPSSVVKELVENAIDAKATSITVEIRDGGTTLVRITDNGCGIEKSQIAKAFLRHSTSKIREITDLLTISSLGFRGEALSSIAAVSQLELITKPHAALTGCRYRIEGGKEILLEEIGAPDGSTFLVRNLFYNTPARRKFLKTPQTEAGYVSALMEHLALSRPDISFQFMANGQVKFRTSGNGGLKDIIYQIYGRDIASNLIEIHHDSDLLKIDGWIGKPLISRGNRNFETFFVNRRYIRSQLISKAIETGYRGFLMQHKFPFTVLHLTIDPQKTDVNVHPGKMELRISGQEQIFDLLEHTIREALAGKELIPSVTIGREKPEKAPKKQHGPEPFEEKRLERLREAVKKDSPYERKYPQRYSAVVQDSSSETNSEKEGIRRIQTEHAVPKAPADAWSDADDRSGAQTEAAVKAPADTRNDADDRSGTQTNAAVNPPDDAQQYAEPVIKKAEQLSFENLLEQEHGPEYRMIGQLFGTYWLIEYKDQLYMIDQHAAHEKVLYERTMKKYESRQFSSQLLSPPMILNLTMSEDDLLRRHLSAFTDIGFELEPFGEQAWAVRAVPADLYNLNAGELFVSILDEPGLLSDTETPRMVTEKVASMSCKAAVKGNHRLTQAEMEKLIEELLTLENPYFCPHGRPVIISMSRYEVDRKFKRVL